MSLTQYPLLTYHEATDRVLDAVVGGDASPRSRRLAADCIRRAYREITSRRDWRYYYRPFIIETVASQTTGSIAYDYTGGSNERQVTLTGSTWPTNVNQYALIISGTRYGIDRYISSTVLTLQERDCPTSDIAASTGYTLVRDTYPLPADFRRMFTLQDVDANNWMVPVEPADILREQRLVRGAAVPRLYSVYRDEQYASALALHFAPSCSSVRRYAAYGQFWPAELRVLDYSGIGTVSVTNGSPTVTGSSTVFAAEHEGCAIRINKNADVQVPTSLIGDVTGNRFAPYAEQQVIRTYGDSTTLTLEQNATQTLAGSGYRISSRIDLEPNAMTNAFLRLAEAMFSPGDRKGAAERMAMFERELIQAMWADQRMIETPGPSFVPSTLADVAASVDATGG